MNELYINKKLIPRECGYKLGCSNVTILNRLREYDIPVRTNSEAHKGILRPYNEKTIDERRLKKIYIKNKYTMTKCGKLFNCSIGTIKNRLIKLDIPIRGVESNRGRKWTEARKKIFALEIKGKGNPMYGRRGKEAPNWKNGLSREPYPLDWRETLKESIRQRDNYKCQICRMPECENIQKLSIHHIDYDKDNLNPENLISLCRSCHTKTNYKRKYWEKYFEECHK